MKDKKNKKHKEKTISGLPSNFEMGKMIKNISVDKKKFSYANLILLIILNIVLISVMIYYITIMFHIAILLVEIFVTIGLLTWSILSYKLGVLKIRYILYENAIVKDYDSAITVGALTQLKGFKIKQTLLDKCGKPSYTITLHFDNKMYKTISFSCINEDVNKLMYQINLQSKQAKKQTNPIKKEEKENIEDIIIKNLPQSKLTEEQQKMEQDEKSSNDTNQDELN